MPARRRMVGGAAQISGEVAYTIAVGLITVGVLGCFIMQVVARRLRRDIEYSQAVLVTTSVRTRVVGKYVVLETPGPSFRLTRAGWERQGLPSQAEALTIAFTPASRVVLAVNGLAVFP